MKLNFDNILVDKKACLNYLASEQICSACADSCPTKAINFEKQTPVINQSSCINCGLCISECQTLALDSIEKPYANTSLQIKSYPNASITCNQMENYQKGIKLPCYLFLDAPLLLQYGDEEKIIKLYTGVCAKCDKSEFVSVENHIKKIQQQLRELGSKLVIHMEPTILNNVEDQVLDGLTRRELFKKISIKSMGEAILSKGTDSGDVQAEAMSTLDRTRHKRQLINDYMAINPLLTTEFLPVSQFAIIDIDEGCSGCNICEKVCPTNAITWNTVGITSELIFDTKYCIACQKCNVCPEEAVKIESIFANQFLQANNTKTLQKFNVRECQLCGEVFRTKLPADICKVCDVKQNHDSKRFFAHYLT